MNHAASAPPVSSPSSLDLSFLPEQSLYGNQSDDIGWQLSPTPYWISSQQAEQLQQLGNLLWQFINAIDKLYRQSANPNLDTPSWIAPLYDQGKPDQLLKLAGMKRLKSHLPLVLRPDLLIHESGWTLCEVDAVPGGIGFTSALSQFYKKNGFTPLESPDGMPAAFLNMLKAFIPEKENPVIAIVLSDEANDYRPEMQWLTDTIRAGNTHQAAYTNLFLVHPKDLELIRDQLVLTDPATGQEKPIDLIYRFFELFDLPNIPKMELIQYAVKKGLVTCTPPFKPHIEEKLSLALLHHPVLQHFWEQELGSAGFAQMRQWVPPSWILDPTPLPPQGIIANLAPGGKPVQDFRELQSLSQKERELVLKPSGFSELAWGSRGVTIGHDHAADTWAEKLEIALHSYGKTPYILQKFIPAKVETLQKLDVTTGESLSFSARTRLCPYYFVQDNQVQLAGVLATACPANKKLIHGMKDAILAPVAIHPPV